MGQGRKLASLSERAVRLVASSSVARCQHASLKSLMVCVVKVVFVTASFLVTTCCSLHIASNARVFTGGHFCRAYVSRISTLREKKKKRCYLQASRFPPRNWANWTLPGKKQGWWSWEFPNLAQFEPERQTFSFYPFFLFFFFCEMPEMKDIDFFTLEQRGRGKARNDR